MKTPHRVLSFLCVGVLVISVFAGISFSEALGAGGTNEVVLVRDVEKEGSNIFDAHHDIEVVDRYGQHVLLELPEKKIPELEKDHEIDRLNHRNTLKIKGHTFDTKEGFPDFGSDLMIEGYEEGEEGIYIIDMIGPVNPDWREELESMGVEIINYQPNYAFEARMTPEQAEEVEEKFFVDWVGVYQPGFKLQDDLEPGTVNIKLVEGASLESLKTIQSKVDVLSVTGLGTYGTQVRVEVDDGSLFSEIARMKEVYYVSKAVEPKLHDEMATQIIGGGLQEWDPDDPTHPSWEPYRGEGDYGSKANQMGYTGENVVVAVADTGLGDGTAGSAGHPDFQERVLGGTRFDQDGVVPDGNWGDNEGSPEEGQGHGTHVTGSIAGNTHLGSGMTEPETWNYTEELGPYYVAQGSAPDAKLHMQKVFMNATIPNDIYLLPEEAEQSADAYVHSNSWGSTENFGEYLITSEVYDAAVRDSNRESSGNQPMIITTASGNEGPDANTVSAPATGKNVIAVGGTENFNPELEAEWGEYFDCRNPDNVAAFSSRGWTNDNRIKPDVVAPGDGIDSTYWDAEQGQPGYIPISGTSMANPAVAGASAVVVQWYEETYGYTPSPAMVRGLMINTAFELDDANGNTTSIPNRDEGWGMVNLPGMIDSNVEFILKDQTSLLTTGEQDEYEVECEDTSEPFKISLTWTDEEASDGDEWTLKNDLNLVVESPTGQEYTGNAFENSWTPPNQDAMGDFDTTDDGYDNVNNIENVYIPPDEVESGNYTVRVIGENVPEDANNDGDPNQDYSLVVHNAAPQGPSVDIVSPQEGDVVRDSNVTVEWTAENFEHNEVRLDGGSWVEVGTSTQYTFEDVENGDHTVEVNTTGQEGETVSDSVSFTVQTVGIEIVTPQEGQGFKERDFVVEWSSEYADYHEIRKDGGNWENVSDDTSYTYNDVEEGSHTVEVRATDVEENEATDGVSFFVDQTPPTIEIESPEDGDTFGSDSVTVEWSGSDDMSGIDHYEVRVDDDTWEDVGESTSHTLEDLEDGDNSVDVRAVDSVGNEEETNVSFVVDTTPPDFQIDSPEEGDLLNVSEITVEWSGEDEGSGIDHYKVRIDGGSWNEVGSDTSHTFSGLEDGEHTVEVEGVDDADNTETKSVSFEIDTTPPEFWIVSPSEGDIFGEAEITVSWDTEGGDTDIEGYEIRGSGNEWKTPDTETDHTFTGLDDGDHIIQVKARDEAGNEAIEEISVLIDTTPPELEIISPETDTEIDGDSVQVEWSGESTGSQIVNYEVRIDGNEWIEPDESTSHVFEDVEDGDHTVEIRATDEAGNTAVESREITIETGLASIGILGGYWWLIPLILIVLIVVIIVVWKKTGEEEEEEYSFPTERGPGYPRSPGGEGVAAVGGAGGTAAAEPSMGGRGEARACPACGSQLRWIDEYGAWYCERCQEYREGESREAARGASGYQREEARAEGARACPACGSQLRWIDEYGAWYCERCQEYREGESREAAGGAAGYRREEARAEGARACPACGSQLRWIDEYGAWYCERCQEYREGESPERGAQQGAAAQYQREESHTEGARTCPDCGGQLRWIEEYEMWYCERCGDYK